jgi:hypothetical protein
MKRISTKGTKMNQGHKGKTVGHKDDLRVLSFPFVTFVDVLYTSGSAQ